MSLTSMSEDLSELYNNRKIELTQDQFERLAKRAKEINEDISRVGQALERASNRFQELQIACMLGTDDPVIKSFSLATSGEQIYPLPQGSIMINFNFSTWERHANTGYGRTGHEGMRIAINPWSNGFFDVLADLADTPGGRVKSAEWLKNDPSVDSCFSYDVLPDAIATTELWLEQNYPREILDFFREECIKIGLVAAGTKPQSNVSRQVLQ